MSNHDRGAYAPHSDAPLTFETFDARARAGRRPFPMALIGSGVVLLLLVTALVMFYRGGSRAAEGLPRPVGGGVAAIKTAPTGPQPSDPTAGLEVYSPQNVPTNTMAATAPAPQFAPAPEQPLARPAPPPAAVRAPAPSPAARPATAARNPAAADSADTVEAPAGKVAHAAPVKPPSAPAAAAGSAASTVATVAKSAAAKSVVKPASVVSKITPASKPHAASSTAASEQAEDLAAVGATSPSAASGTITTALKPTSPARTSASTKLATAASKPVAHKAVAPTQADDGEEPTSAVLPKGSLAPAKPTAAAIPAAKGGFMVQVGAFPSAADADKGFSTASVKAGGAMSGKSKHVETVQKDGKTFYRSTVKGFSTRDAAAQFCVALRAKGGQCIVRAGAGA